MRLMLPCVLAFATTISGSTSIDAQARVQRTLEPVGPDNPAISVKGVVVNAEGKPLAGAAVVLRSKENRRPSYPLALGHNGDFLARTKTDVAGRFTFDKIGVPLRLVPALEELLRGKAGAELLAWSDGMGIAWRAISQLTTADPVRLVLTPEEKMIGTVRDKAGKALSDVRVALMGATRGNGDPFEDRRPDDLDLFLSELTFATTTDKAGQFTLHHVPAGYRVDLRTDGRGLKFHYVFVETRKDNTDTSLRIRTTDHPVLRSPLKIEMTEEPVVRVTVKDHAGQPVGVGAVEVMDEKRSRAGRARLDPSGDAFVGLSKTGKLDFHYVTDPLQPRLNVTVTIDIPAGKEPPAVEIRLPEPRWLTGTVVDADSGRGLVGAHVSFGQTRDPKSRDPRIDSSAVSGTDGQFRIPVVPGNGQMYFSYDLYGYYTPERPRRTAGAKIEVPKSGELKQVTLKVNRGLAIRAVVRDESGKPAPGTYVSAQYKSRDYHDRLTDANGRFELMGLPPSSEVKLRLVGPAGVAAVTVPAAPDHPSDKTRWHDVEIKLKAGVALTGRVIYDGKPRPDVKLSLYCSSNQFSDGGFFGYCKTDAEGRFRIAGLDPGDSFYFDNVVDPDGLILKRSRFDFNLERFVPKDVKEVRLKDLELVSRGQTLRGIVVDPKGNPVAGARISAMTKEGMPPSYSGRGAMPWTKTDKDGKFELKELPSVPLSVMASIPSPSKDGKTTSRVRFPNITTTTMNQQNIRIVLDPMLGNEIEDLDNPKKAPPKK